MEKIPAMIEGSVFISYSRQELYFAESLAVSLQEKGVSVWFDIQQLKPGFDWKEGIQYGVLD